MRMVWSTPADRIDEPSGENSTVKTAALWPKSSTRGRCDSRSQIVGTSLEAVTRKRPSALNPTSDTGPA
jgi:hypothetical protein